MLPLGPIVITRQQYEEAIGKLPDPATFTESSVEVEVDAADLFKKLNFRKRIHGAQDWPMMVRFEKITTDSPLYGVFAPGECWQLDRSYSIV